jgi:hypothetical protein
MLSHPHRSFAGLKTVDGDVFDTYHEAYQHCQIVHAGLHVDGYYGQLPEPDPDEFEPEDGSIQYDDYIKHAMRWRDRRFARHPRFRFVSFNP